MLPWGWFQYRIETLTPPRWNSKFTWCNRYHMCHVNRDSLTHCSQGSVAQLVEQRTSNPKVVGSNPTWATEFFKNSVGHFSVGYHHWCSFSYFPLFEPCIIREQCTLWHHFVCDYVLKQLKHKNLCFVQLKSTVWRHFIFKLHKNSASLRSSVQQLENSMMSCRAL